MPKIGVAIEKSVCFALRASRAQLRLKVYNTYLIYLMRKYIRYLVLTFTKVTL